MKSNEVYKITNKVTNKVYIGITNQGSGARYRHHWYESRIGEPSPIHRSMAKYGEENFTLEIIDFADTYDELKEIIQNGWAESWWCGSADCEAKIKEETKATTRCMPFDQPKTEKGKCVYCGAEAVKKIYFSKAY